MHKNFYASGFLYHPSSQQILLQQNNSMPLISPSWVLVGGQYLEKEDPEALFKNKIFELLDIKIKVVHSIYSYLNENTDEFQYIVYSNLSKFQNFSSKSSLTFAWFYFKDVLKLKIAEQTKHDIVVGQRVIEAAERKSRGEHTFQ
ncbi:MAG: hypothetical protein Q8P26_05070 [Candidatus Levybacteria bacterium]|nr:hypothetical protein [Candidatus Levybacteria bacterium]